MHKVHKVHGVHGVHGVLGQSVADQRIWRLRKLHQAVDAELHAIGDEVEVRFLFNGELSYTRRCATRQLALETAAAKRLELEREGWMFHW